MPQVVITQEMADRAAAKLIELMDREDERGLSVQQKAASDLIRLFQSQERYFAKPEAPEDYERALGYRGSEAQRLEAMTPEDIIEISERMLAGRPGRPGRSQEDIVEDIIEQRRKMVEADPTAPRRRNPA